MNPQGNQPVQPNPGFVPYFSPEQQTGYFPTSTTGPYREQQPRPVNENQWNRYSPIPTESHYIPYQIPAPVQPEYRIPMEPIMVTKMTHHYNNAVPMAYPNPPPGYYYPSSTMAPVGQPIPVQSGADIPYAIPVGTPYSYTIQTNPSSPYVYIPSSSSPSTENSKANGNEKRFGEKAVNTAKVVGTAVGNTYKEWCVCIIMKSNVPIIIICRKE